jgi:predicted small lipoprotein YifL
MKRLIQLFGFAAILFTVTACNSFTVERLQPHEIPPAADPNI